MTKFERLKQVSEICDLIGTSKLKALQGILRRHLENTRV